MKSGCTILSLTLVVWFPAAVSAQPSGEPQRKPLPRVAGADTLEGAPRPDAGRLGVNGPRGPGILTRIPSTACGEQGIAVGVLPPLRPRYVDGAGGNSCPGRRHDGRDGGKAGVRGARLRGNPLRLPRGRARGQQRRHLRLSRAELHPRPGQRHPLCYRAIGRPAGPQRKLRGTGPGSDCTVGADMLASLGPATVAMRVE